MLLSNEVIGWSTDHPINALQMVMNSDETQIQIFADCPMSHAKHTTKDNRKNAEYHVDVAIMRLRVDKTIPRKNHSQTMIKMSSISDLKRPTAPKIQSKHNDTKYRKLQMLPYLGINVAVKTQKCSDNYQNIRIMLAVLRFKNGRNSASFLK